MRRADGRLLVCWAQKGRTHLSPVCPLPSAHLRALGPGEPPWAALAPRRWGRGAGAGACWAVDQQPGHLFHNRSQEAATEPVLRSPLSMPLLVTRQGPGGKVSTLGRGQMESDLHLRVWNHTQESSPFSPFLFSLLPPPPSILI